MHDVWLGCNQKVYKSRTELLTSCEKCKILNIKSTHVKCQM
jgi:hypothetical protein